MALVGDFLVSFGEGLICLACIFAFLWLMGWLHERFGK